MSHPLDGSFLKLRRAKEHLKVADGLMEGVQKRHPHQIVDEIVRNGDTRERILRFKQTEEINPDIPLLIGDICNNLRSTLDYLLWQLWLLKNPTFGGDVYFPICDFPRDFITPRVNKSINELSDVQMAAIESLQPYKTGNPALSFLRDVNNSDKHRLVQVIVYLATVKSLKITITQPNGIIVPPQQIFPQLVHGAKIKDGAIVARIPYGRYPTGSTVRVQAEITIDHAFEGCKSADGKSIKPSIDAMISEVSHAIILFEPEFSSFGVSKFK